MTGEPPRRRKALLASANEWLAASHDQEVGTHAICLALKPYFRTHSTDPIVGDTVTVTSGLLPVEEIQELSNLWDEVILCIRRIELANWKHILAALSDWTYPQRFARTSLDDAVATEIRATAS